MSNKNVIIDYLSATAGMVYEGNDCCERTCVFEYVEIFRKYFKLEHFQVEECRYGTNNFKYQYILSNYIILRFAGPYNEFMQQTWQIELKGEGCREFERLRPDITWCDFLNFLLGFNVNFKRFDLTIDDFEGKQIKLSHIFDKTKKRQYTSVFKSKPTYHGILEDGLTIDFGSRTSMTELCIYDKKKQQVYLGKPVEHDYWVRYELRFRQNKADAIVMDLLMNYENKDVPIYGLNLQEYATKALYATIDFKEDNNYDEHDQSKVPTDPQWKAFVGDIERGKLPAPDLKKSTYESAYRYIMPKAKNILLTWLVQSNYDKNLFLLKIITELERLVLDLTIKQSQRINQYLSETMLDFKPLTNEDFDIMRKKLYEIDEDLSLPF